MEEPQPILYETLFPLIAATDDDPATTPPPQPPSSSSIEDSEPYTVFRSQISLSSILPSSPDTTAPDFFSLDANEKVEVNGGENGFKTPPFRVKSAAAAEERTLEGNWFRGNCRFKSPMLQLHKEIIDFCDFLSPTPEEQDSRNAAIERVFDVIKYIWPNCKPEVFGSFRTGLYLPSSDVDLVILGSNIVSPPLGLNALAKALSRKGIAKKMQVIAKARVPIVKFVEKKSDISFDISFDVDNGPKAADFIKDAISLWPPLRPLCLILKVFLQQRELNEVYTGGIGSYALLAMLIAMLRSQPHYHTSPEHNLGVLLVNFFDMYGRKLNTFDVGVSCNGEGIFFMKSSKGFSNMGKTSLLSIQDPQAPENDIGKSSFNYFQVKSAFSMGFSILTNLETIFGLGPNRSILGMIIRPDAVLLERKGGSNGEVTFNNLLPDAGDPVQQPYGDQQEMYCNWRSNDMEEESFPRGNIDTVESSGRKKRRKPIEKRLAKKLKEYMGSKSDGEKSKKKDKAKKPRHRHLQNGNDSSGNGHFRGGRSSWNQS